MRVFTTPSAPLRQRRPSSARRRRLPPRPSPDYPRAVPPGIYPGAYSAPLSILRAPFRLFRGSLPRRFPRSNRRRRLPCPLSTAKTSERRLTKS